MYTGRIKDSLVRMEKTRDERLSQTFAPPSADEKSAILKNYHPDYREGTAKPLRVGPNKGEDVVNEFAAILEGYSCLDTGKIDLSRIDHDVDVLVIGGGGAGSSAALLARDCGVDSILMATKLRLGDANTMMAQGGIQAADKSNDSPAIHYLDAMGGGGFHNVPELVRTLVMDAPEVIHWLEDLGVMLDKEPDGTMVSIHGGGTSRKRMHSCRDYSGGEIMKTLKDEVRNREIEVLEFTPAVELLTDGNKCTGAVLCDLETQEYRIVRAKVTIIATGGSGRLHAQGFATTNHYGATGDGLVMAYRAGCNLKYLDTIQYHPTGAAFPEQIMGLLVTEKCRGLGAHLVNDHGERFIRELETRDVVASAIIREVEERGNGVKISDEVSGVWLDTPLIDRVNGEGTTKKMLPAMYRQYMRYDINFNELPILVYPTQHYQNGGIAIHDGGQADIENLYMAGEVSGGVHGRNRLMGNSLLDVLVFGRQAGKAAAEKVKNTKSGPLTLAHLDRYHKELTEADIPRAKTTPILLPDYTRVDTRSRRVEIDL